jgi:hypothetical protein
MVQQAQKPLKTDLTAFSQNGLAPEVLAHLERDRWPEFERELRRRRLRKTHFDLWQFYGDRPRWVHLLWQCRKWEEVEKVLNKHNVGYRWKQRRAVMELPDAEIYRLS